MLGAIKNGWRLLKEAGVRWYDHEPFRNSAILAYYAIFSLPGIIIIIINLAGYFFGQEAVRGEIHAQIGTYIDETAAEAVEKILANVNLRGETLIPTVIGVATILFGASGVFYQLQQSLNTTWNIKAVPKKAFLKYLKDRLFSFSLVLAIGFILLISLVLSSLLVALSKWVITFLPSYTLYLFRIVNVVVSFGMEVLIFALVYKILPDAEIRWRDVWIGALVTALLFEGGKYGLSVYFGNADPASSYGAAGSLILLLLWFSYSSLILLYGAEFTFVQAKHIGEHILPSNHAVFVKEVEYKDIPPE